MRAGLGLAALLVLLGLALGAPGLVFVGLLVAGTRGLAELWSRHGLRRVTYRRLLERRRAVWGDSVELTLEVTNGKWLPLAWLQVEEVVNEGTVVREVPLVPHELPGLVVLRRAWSLAPFQRIRSHLHLEAVRRGIVRFESVRLSVADLFGRGVASQTLRQPESVLVRPRTVPVQAATGTVVPLGTRRARQGLLEDPALFAGVRPYQRGDPRRRIHQRASARLGQPVSKRFEPSIARQVVIAVDLQTAPGPSWLLAYDEELVEALIVAAASLARYLLDAGAACGLAANGWTYTPARVAVVPPRAGPGQLSRITDVLARLSQTPSAPFARLLASLPARLPGGSLVLILGGRDPTDYLSAVARLRGAGFAVRHLAMGPQAALHASRLRTHGFDAAVAHLDPDWRRAASLTVA
jgi:uncharacterized protein (DUF58 family)